MAFLYGESLTLHARGVTGEDSDGNDVYGDTDTTSPGWVVYPRTAVELVQGQDTLIVGITATRPDAVSVAGVDAVSVVTGPYAGRYDIDGLPGHYSSPFTATKVTELHLTKVTG